MNKTFKRHVGLALPLLLGACAAFAQTTIVIDNGSPGFRRPTYGWASSTAGSPTFAGTDHLVANGLTNIIDNTSPLFSTTGNWQVRTDGTDLYGPNAVATVPDGTSRFHFPLKIIDNNTYNSESERGANGWPSGKTLAGYYGSDYQYIEPTSWSGFSRVLRFYVGGDSTSLELTRTIRMSGHWPASSTNATNAVIRVRRVSDPNGAPLAVYTVNQRQASGEWQVLGPTFSIPTWQQLVVEFDATNADGRVIADAIKLESVENYTVNTARWQLPSSSSPRTVDVYARWPKLPWSAVHVGWGVVGGTGKDYVTVGNGLTSQAYTSGRWVKIGRTDLQGSQQNYVLLEQAAIGGQVLAADAVTYVPYETFPWATWELSETGGNPVDVYVQWSADASRAADARYTVTSFVSDGANSCQRVVTTVFVDQRDANAAARTYLGRFTAGSAFCGKVTVELMPNSGVGTLSADAVTFVVN